MTDQTDAEFIAEMKALAESATGLPDVPWEARNGDVWFDGERVARDCWTPDAAFIAAARTAIPRLIGMVEAEKKRADDAEAERDSLRVNAVDDAFVKRVMEMPDAELLASVEPGEIDLNKQLFKTAKMRVERDTALAEVARLREALIPIVDEFSCTIEQYYKIGPDFTHKDGTEVFIVQTVLDREPLIVAARAALASKETP
jgi:hypothetical protein